MIENQSLYILGINSIIIFIQTFSISYIYDSLFDKQWSVNKNIKIMVYSVMYGAFSIVFYSLAETGTWQFRLIDDLCGNLLPILFLIYILYPEKKKEVIYFWVPLMMCAGVWKYLIWSLSGIIEERIMFKETLLTLAIQYIFVYCLLIYLFTVLTFKILIKINYIDYFKILLDFPKLCIVWFILYIGVSVYGLFMEFDTLDCFMLMLVIVIAIFICMMTAKDFLSKKKIEQDKGLILQQEHYVKRLEGIQQELRLIQHDYKNMISSLYAQASDGNSDSIKDFIETKLMGVDSSVQENINQMNQVLKIELPELKGLVLAKIIEAEQKGVLLKIEIMNTVSDAAIDKNDLIRCVGILLDNALEASQGQFNAEVTLVLLSETDKFTAAVKNLIQKKPDLTKIWQQGYSTKGADRGLGLTSYKRILNKYSNISCDTKVTDDTFLQLLLISNM